MAQITISNLTFCYDGSYDNVFENFSLQWDTTWKTGLTGRNGRGKTTLLRLLMNRYPYSGTISSTTCFAAFPFEVEVPELSPYELLESLVPQAQIWQLEREASLLELSASVLVRPFCTLSGGEQAKILLAILFLTEDFYLLIDEPTNHLDLTGRRVVADYLHKKSGFMLVSHDRNFLDACVDHMIALNKTGPEIQKGGFSSWYLNKVQRDQQESETNARLEKEMKRLEQGAQQAQHWSNKVEKTKHGSHDSELRPDKGYLGHKSAKMMRRAKSLELRNQKAAQDKSRLLKDAEYTSRLILHPLRYHNQRLAEAKELRVRRADKVLNTPINFTVYRGDRIAIIGKNGCGKTSLLRLLLRQGQPDFDAALDYSGSLSVGNGVTFSYISQETEHLEGSLAAYAKSHALDETLLKTILRKLDFSRLQLDKNIADLSQGQRKKVLLATSLCKPAHLYVWDEPLNYVDVFSRMQIEKLLLEFAPTMVFVEHDAAFVDKIATHTVILTDIAAM